MLNKIFIKLGYTKMEYLHQSRALVREVREQIKEKNIELNNNSSVIKKLKTEVTKLSTEVVELSTPKVITFSTSKLKYWGDKVKRTKCCDICDVKNQPLTAHHIWAKSLHPTLAYEHANGVALCLVCHEGYHKKYPHIEDCNPYTYGEYKTDEQNKIRLSVVEKEVEILKSKTISNRIKSLLKRVA